MQTKTTRIEVLSKSHRKVKRFAKRMGFNVPEAYQRLADFGMDAMERQKVLLAEVATLEAGQEASDRRR